MPGTRDAAVSSVGFPPLRLRAAWVFHLSGRRSWRPMWMCVLIVGRIMFAAGARQQRRHEGRTIGAILELLWAASVHMDKIGISLAQVGFGARLEACSQP